MEEIRLGSINKEGLFKNKLLKGDLGGIATKPLRLISFPNREKSFLLLDLSFARPYLRSFYFFKRTFLQPFIRRYN